MFFSFAPRYDVGWGDRPPAKDKDPLVGPDCGLIRKQNRVRHLENLNLFQKSKEPIGFDFPTERRTSLKRASATGRSSARFAGVGGSGTIGDGSNAFDIEGALLGRAGTESLGRTGTESPLMLAPSTSVSPTRRPHTAIV
ncbi:unnamed protein product, partial [Amoebophrya sp. A25]|eukprot:GSA25T00009233001.1